MKLNIDLGYILKRIIVIVIAFVIIQSIKGCEVFAQSVNLTFTPYSNTCYGTGFDLSDNSINLSNGSIVSKNVFNSSNTSYSCSFTATRNQTYSISLGQTSRWLGSRSGTVNLRFTVYGQAICDEQDSNDNCIHYDYRDLEGFAIGTNTAFGSSFKCNVSETIKPTDRSYFSYSTTSVECKDYTIPSSTTFSYITLNGFRSQRHFYISKNFQLITTSEQQIANDLNDSSLDSNTQNANGIFDTDSNGQPTNSLFQSYGIETIITGPLRILQRSTESCSPVSFTIFSKSITLPCGDTLFWNRDFSSQQSIFTSGVSGSGLNSTRNTFRDLWNLLFGGAIIFHLLLKLYDVIQKAVDPMSDDYQNINSAIDTSGLKAVRDNDGDFDSSSMDKLRATATLAKGVYDDDSYHALKGRRV